MAIYNLLHSNIFLKESTQTHISYTCNTEYMILKVENKKRSEKTQLECMCKGI